MTGDPQAHTALFRLTGVGVVETDMATGRLKQVNQTFCEMVGYSEAELLNMTNAELTHPDDWDRDAETFTAMGQGDVDRVQALSRVRHKDGSVRWLELHVTLLEIAGKRTNLAVINDVTERKRADDALRQNDTRRAFLLSLSDALRPLADAVDIQATATRTALEHFGADRCYYCEIEGGEAIIRRDASRGDLPSVVGAYPLDTMPVFKAVVEAGRPFVVADANTTDLLDHTLRQLCLQTQVISFIDVPVIKTGRPVGLLCITQGTPRLWTDLELELAEETAERTWAAVERGRAEAASRTSEELLQLTVESVRDYAIFTLDRERRVTSWNSGAERAFGYSRDEIVGQSGDVLFTPEDRAAGVPEHEVGAALEEGRADDDRWHLRRDGSRFFASGVVTPLGNGEQTTGFVKVARDLTEQREAEAERERLVARLRDLNETLEQRVLERTEALRASEQRFSQAFYTNPIPACMTTYGLERETFVEVNDALLELTGYARDEIVGHTSRELGMWSSSADQKRLSGAQRDGQGFRNLELRLRTKAGELRDVLMSAEVIRLNGDLGYLKMFYDISERKRTEEEMHQAVQAVMNDATWFSRELIEQLSRIRTGGGDLPSVELSRRERQVLGLMAGGLSNEAIAQELTLRPQTVRNYVAAVYDKLGVNTRAEAIVWARERGITGR